MGYLQNIDSRGGVGPLGPFQAGYSDGGVRTLLPQSVFSISISIFIFISFYCRWARWGVTPLESLHVIRGFAGLGLDSTNRRRVFFGVVEDGPLW